MSPLEATTPGSAGGRLGENLIMTGHPQDDPRLSGGIYGIRYVRRHKVLKTVSSSEGRALYV